MRARPLGGIAGAWLVDASRHEDARGAFTELVDLQELAQESWEAWQNGKGWSWVTRFTPRGLARIRQAYAEYGDDVRRTEDD